MLLLASRYVSQGDFLRLISHSVLLVGVWRAIRFAEFGQAVAENARGWRVRSTTDWPSTIRRLHAREHARDRRLPLSTRSPNRRTRRLPRSMRPGSRCSPSPRPAVRPRSTRPYVATSTSSPRTTSSRSIATRGKGARQRVVPIIQRRVALHRAPPVPRPRPGTLRCPPACRGAAVAADSRPSAPLAR
jgi:hypothetical protein